jgi:hypothetical protein
MLFITNGRGHPRRTVTGITIKIGDVFDPSQITTVPAKWRLASEETVEEIIGMITREVTSNTMIIEMRQAPADKKIGQGSRGHTIYHLQIF